MALNLAKLIKEATVPKSFSEHFEHAYYQTLKNQQRPRTPKAGYFSPSSLYTSCVRNLYYKYLGTPEEPDTRPVSQLGPNLGILQNGNDRHERIQENVTKMFDNGFEIEWIDVEDYLKEFKPPGTSIVEKMGFETKLYNDIISSRFMCDGILKYKGEYYILEIKTMGSYKWRKAEKLAGPLEEHKPQGSTYGLILGIDKVLFVYENRDNMKLLCKEYKILESDKKNIIDTVEAVKTYAAIDRIPPRTLQISDCKWCKYKTICGTDGFTESAYKE